MSFIDDIDIFGYKINITSDFGFEVYNITNTSLSGSIVNFSAIINVSGPQGNYTVNVTVFDTHTATAIPKMKVNKGIQNFLLFDKKIRITAEGAIYSNVKKKRDRYNFQFNYIPFLAPHIKVFYVESDSTLYYQKDSPYTAHFVDWENRKWIDFEGLSSKPIITKINDRKWKIEFNNKDSKVVFSSLGVLNEHTEIFRYYLSNVSVEWFIPTETVDFLGTSFTVSLNVTGDGKNFTRFRLYNSSNDLVQTKNLTATNQGSHFYNTTFSDLTDTQYFVNATHTDVNGENKTSETRTLNNIGLTNCVLGFPVINFTIKDETDDTRVVGDAVGTFNYNGTTEAQRTTTFTRTITDQNNFSVCINPANQELIADYSIVYSATNYQQRVFDVEQTTFDNNTQLKTLFLLNDTTGIFGRFQVVDQFQSVESGVRIEMTKTGETDIIEIRTTDDAGQAAFFVNPDQTYDFTFTKTGFQTLTTSLRITSGDIITVTLVEEGVAEQESFSTEIRYDFYPKNTVLQNKTDVTFSFNMTSTFYNISACTLYLRNTSERLASNSCFFNSSQGNTSIVFNTGNQTLIISEAIYQLNMTTNETVSVQYKVQYTFQGEFSLKTFIEDIRAFAGAGFNDFTRMFISFLFILGIIGFVAANFTELREPEPMILLFLALVLMFSFIGMLTLNYEAIPDDIPGLTAGWLNQYIIFILLFLTGGSYLIRRHFST